MFETIIGKILLSIIFGSVIGIEREGSHHGPESLGGIRTYSLIGLLGALTGIFYLNNFSLFSGILFSAFFLLLISCYFMGVIRTKDLGMTTELAVIFTFLSGLFVVLDIIPLHLLVSIFVLVVLILSLKTTTRKISSSISKKELQSFINYAIIALIVLPFLPNFGYKLSDIPFLSQIFSGLNIDLGKFALIELINPRKIWMIVVLITGIDVFGYLLGRLIGNKSSFTLTSFVAGFISSTSTTQSLAQRSKKLSIVNYLVGAALLANLASFFQIFLLVGPLNAKWLVSVMPSIFIMIISTTFLAIFFLKKKEKTTKQQESEKQDKNKIFSLAPALRFAGLLIVIKIVTKVSLVFIW